MLHSAGVSQQGESLMSTSDLISGVIIVAALMRILLSPEWFCVPQRRRVTTDLITLGDNGTSANLSFI